MSDVETQLRSLFKVGSKIDVQDILFEIVKVEGCGLVLSLDEYSKLWCKNCNTDLLHGGVDCDNCIHNYESNVNVGNH